MKRKSLKVLCILLVIAVILSGCVQNNDRVSSEESRFVGIGDMYKINGYKYWVHYDSKTNIVYILGNNSYSSGVTALYNSKGEPMTLDEYYETR